MLLYLTTNTRLSFISFSPVVLCNCFYLQYVLFCLWLVSYTRVQSFIKTFGNYKTHVFLVFGWWIFNFFSHSFASAVSILSNDCLVFVILESNYLSLNEYDVTDDRVIMVFVFSAVVYVSRSFLSHAQCIFCHFFVRLFVIRFHWFSDSTERTTYVFIILYGHDANCQPSCHFCVCSVKWLHCCFN